MYNPKEFGVHNLRREISDHSEQRHFKADGVKAVSTDKVNEKRAERNEHVQTDLFVPVRQQIILFHYYELLKLRRKGKKDFIFRQVY